MIALKLRDIALENEKGIKTLPEVRHFEAIRFVYFGCRVQCRVDLDHDLQSGQIN